MSKITEKTNGHKPHIFDILDLLPRVLDPWSCLFKGNFNSI